MLRAWAIAPVRDSHSRINASTELVDGEPSTGPDPAAGMSGPPGWETKEAIGRGREGGPRAESPLRADPRMIAAPAAHVKAITMIEMGNFPRTVMKISIVCRMPSMHGWRPGAEVRRATGPGAAGTLTDWRFPHARVVRTSGMTLRTGEIPDGGRSSAINR